VSDASISLSVDDDFPWLAPLSRLLLMAELTPEETEAFDQLPQEEALALLDLLVNRYGITLKRSGAPMTEADRHQLDVGHRLAFGCCRPVEPTTSGAETCARAY
jgi:hypothetical protein